MNMGPNGANGRNGRNGFDRGLGRRKLVDRLFRAAGVVSISIVAGSLALILGTILWKSLPALNLDMITKTPGGGYYIGKEGGILNAIAGSLYLGLGATLLAFLVSLPLALFLNTYRTRTSRFASFTRFSLDVLWGVPSIVYGAFGFILMAALGLKASLLAGIMTVALLEFPIMTRSMDEVIRLVPIELAEASAAAGATRLQTAFKVIARQCGPGIMTAVLMAFGRGIGDAASVLFTAGYTDRVPVSLLQPAATLPLAIFFQIGTPYPEVQQRAYASAAILTLLVLGVSLTARALSRRLKKTSVR